MREEDSDATPISGYLWPDSPELDHYTSVREGGQPFLRIERPISNQKR